MSPPPPRPSQLLPLLPSTSTSSTGIPSTPAAPLDQLVIRHPHKTTNGRPPAHGLVRRETAAHLPPTQTPRQLSLTSSRHSLEEGRRALTAVPSPTCVSDEEGISVLQLTTQVKQDDLKLFLSYPRPVVGGYPRRLAGGPSPTPLSDEGGSRHPSGCHTTRTKIGTPYPLTTSRRRVQTATTGRPPPPRPCATQDSGGHPSLPYLSNAISDLFAPSLAERSRRLTAGLSSTALSDAGFR